MKASVITLTSVRNYGTQLQALATQVKLEEYYDEVELINYRRYDTYGKGLMNSYAKGNFIRGAAILPTMAVWHYRFGNFQKNYLHLTNKRYETESDFQSYNQDADVYFSGSDQVWNSGWNNGIIPFLYLSFIDSCRVKAAFSSSFGRKSLSQEEIDACKPLLDQFSQLSVRETSGERILKDDFHYTNVIRLVDPTLSLPADYWRSVETGQKIPKGYIFIYGLNKNPELDNFARRLSEKTGLPAYRFCTRFDQVTKFGIPLMVPNVLDFVGLVDHAQYVVTDSFHATAFSMNMGTDMICIPPKKYSGRLTEFLSLVHEEKRIVSDFDDFSIVDRPTNFDAVNAILEVERNRVDEYLSSLPHSKKH